MMRIIYIHGATASEKSFAFIQQSIKAKKHTFLNYDHNMSAMTNLDSLIEELEKTEDDLFIIAHSMGGLYAMHLLERFKKRVKKVISLATPFKGSDVPAVMKMLYPSYELFDHITPYSEFVKQTYDIKVKRGLWIQVVTTVGDAPWIKGENDGIVTRASMTARDDMKKVEIDRNHYEIVQSQRVVDLIKKELDKFKLL